MCPLMMAGTPASIIATVDFAVTLIPGFIGERIDGNRKVLIALVNAVSGPMLQASGNAMFVHTAHVRTRHAQHAFRIRAEGSGVCDRVMEVQIQIDIGREGPVAANGAAFAAADHAQPVGLFFIIGCGDLHGRCEVGSIRRNPVAAAFQVCGDQHRYIRDHLQEVGDLLQASAKRWPEKNASWPY